MATIDRGTIRALRAVSLSAAWARTLAEAILTAPAPLTRGAYEAAIHRDQRLTTAQMLAAAQAVEVGGRL